MPKRPVGVVAVAGAPRNPRGDHRSGRARRLQRGARQRPMWKRAGRRSGRVASAAPGVRLIDKPGHTDPTPGPRSGAGRPAAGAGSAPSSTGSGVDPVRGVDRVRGVTSSTGSEATGGPVRQVCSSGCAAMAGGRVRRRGPHPRWRSRCRSSRMTASTMSGRPIAPRRFSGGRLRSLMPARVSVPRTACSAWIEELRSVTTLPVGARHRPRRCRRPPCRA